MAALPRERERVISSTQTEIRFVADDELVRKLQNIKDLDAHVQANPSYLELFHRMADLVLNELDPLAKEKELSRKAPRRSQATPSEAVSKVTPPGELNIQGATAEPLKSKVSAQVQATNSKKANSRYISAALKREIWRRDQGQCSYQSADGKKCTSRYALEIDHIEPFVLGGKSELSNLRLLCRAHNQQEAGNKLGPQVMRPFMSH